MKIGNKKALWVLPMAAWMAVLYAVPLLIIAYTSFRTQSGDGFTLESYTRFFGNAAYLTALLNSLWLAVRVVTIAFLISFPTAYIICFVVPKSLRLFLLILTIIPFWTNYLIRAYSWITILGGNGIINRTLMDLHLITQPLELLYNETGTLIGLVHYVTPMLILFTYSTMEGISENLLEAACDLGAGRLRTIKEVILPLSSGGLVGGLIYVFIIAFADYITPTTLGGQSIVVFAQLVVDAVQWTINWPLASVLAIAMTVVAAAVIVVILLLRPRGSSLEEGGSGK